MPVPGHADLIDLQAGLQPAKKITVLKGHGGWVMAVAFSPSRNAVASGAADGVRRPVDDARRRQIVQRSGPFLSPGEPCHAPEPVAGEGAWQSATSFPFLAAAQEKPIAIRDVLSLLLQNAGGIVAAARPVTAKELRIHAPIESV